MAQTKPQHYWRQLRSVLTAGLWDARTPAKDTHGRPVSWSDLLRKFHKHCPGHPDVAELASQTQALSLLLSANCDGLDGNNVSPQGVLVLGEECMLPDERIEEAMAGYATLKQLDASRSDSTKAALAYYAYALRRPSDCLDHLSQVKDLSDAQGFDSTSGTTQSAPATLRVPGTSSDISLSSSWTGSFLSAQSPASIADINEGSAWSAIERIRSICVKGMSYELLNPDDPEKAFTTYLLASSLISSAVGEIPASPLTSLPNLSSTPDNSSFARYRELWRWAERVLRRGIILGARICDVSRTDGPNGSLWQLLQQYRACSTHWPPQFRPEQRSAIIIFHLRALILRARAAPTPRPDRSHRWISTARSLVQEYRAILSVCTTFPKAGERNVKVEDLVDLAVATWEADGAVGEYAGWVIDVLWWATRLTFNSFRIFRYMSRLFYVAGDPELARRTLRLYVQIQSLELLKTSLEHNETASTHHHLALAYLRPGASQDLQSAIVHARATVEADPGEARHWHLLGLLLTASGDWRAAKWVLEMGASVSETDLAEDDAEPVDGLPNNGSDVDGVQAHDYASPDAPETNGHANGNAVGDAASVGERQSARLLERDATEVPPSAELLQPLGDRPPANRQEAFEHALELRTTQLVLSEHVEGPEGTCDKWVDVFQWFSERRGFAADDRRMSIDSRRASQDLRPSSVMTGEKRASVPNDIRGSTLFPPVEELPEPTNGTLEHPPPMLQSPAHSQDRDAGIKLDFAIPTLGTRSRRLHARGKAISGVRTRCTRCKLDLRVFWGGYIGYGCSGGVIGRTRVLGGCIVYEAF
ncbi:hypothetical protein L226DRAFT_517343 [Lentinus tigrinus ALCF2SS1-7]|uniref:uncharacterized protein n=1 Tax=Lentinus tigrinus ALCF2SS1-7 TaxID=1328758 RepID=UPI00116605A2|nr:hypothetical protein L226DRAFT_517343 [Lentinus tigrinus ALCF2SS1-7]